MRIEMRIVVIDPNTSDEMRCRIHELLDALRRVVMPTAGPARAVGAGGPV